MSQPLSPGYAARMGVELPNRVQRIAESLPHALSANLLTLHFQPKVRLKDFNVVGAEALLRWEDSDLGRVSPLEILEAAGFHGLTQVLDFWVIGSVVRQIASWQSRRVGLVPVSINLGAGALLRPDFLSTVVRLVAEYDVDPRLIEFELLETASFENLDDVVGRIEECRQSGFRFLLDDFGTGYSSLAYLSSLPLDGLKIDRCLIPLDAGDLKRWRVARQIIEIGHTLDCTVVAEGVEHPDQYLILRSLGCDVIQGFYFARPMAAVDFAAMMRNGTARIPPPGVERL